MYNRYFLAASSVKSFTIRVLLIMIHLFRCRLQCSFLVDLHSYRDYHVYITKLISLAKRGFFGANRAL